VCVCTEKALEYSANASALLLYYNLRDDIADTKGIKSLGKRMLLPYASHLRKKALSVQSELDALIAARISELSEKERSSCDSIYESASVFGELLADVFCSYTNEKEDCAQGRILRQIGYHTGIWIYLADALDDYKDDLKSGSYNPFIASGTDLSDPKELERVGEALVLELDSVAKAAELLECEDEGIKAIIKNIIYLGMPERIATVKKEKYEKEKTK